MSKELLNGYQSALRGAFEAAVDTVCVQDRRFSGVKTDFAEVTVCSNALQYALGASIAGHRAVAVIYDCSTDELASVAHVGVNASLVVLAVDNALRPYCDLRTIAVAAHLPIMEPATVYECKTFVKIACNMSEKYDVPIIVHIGQGMLDTYDEIETVEPKVLQAKTYKRNMEKYVTLPTANKLCAEDMVVRDKRLATDCDAFPVNTVQYRDRTMGVVCYGEAFSALAVAAPHLSVLRLGMVYPLPIATVRDFAQNVEDLVVMEEGEPIVENALKGQGIACHGEDLFPLRMRYTPSEIKERLLGVEIAKDDVSLPIRTPAFCAECPLIDLFTAIKKAEVKTHTDTDCGYLAANIPMVCIDTAFAVSPMALAKGFAKHTPCVAVLSADRVDLNDFRGDIGQLSVFIYGSVQPLCDVLVALGQKAEIIDVKAAADYLDKPGVWLIVTNGECRYG
jgi:indolepyruvate ferredoxin oxidoreductase alpha subunit